MQRTVPHTASDPINLFMRTYYSLLRTTDTMQIQSLIESYLAMDSSLHVVARESSVDISTLVYAGLRVPACIPHITTILLGQTVDVFEKHGYMVGNWQEVESPGRRRRTLWDGEQTLAVFLSSRSDVDDLIPILTAYQIEWNKIYDLLHYNIIADLLEQYTHFDQIPKPTLKTIASELQIKSSDLRRLAHAWGDSFLDTLVMMAQGRKHFRIQQLSGSLADYRKATGRWWANVRETSEPKGYDLEDVPVYFVSSNFHSIANLLSGFAVRERENILSFLNEAGQHDLLQEYDAIRADDQLASNEPNFLYYSQQKFISAHPGAEARKQTCESDIGMLSIPSRRGFDVGAQIFKISNLREDHLDPRLCDIDNFEALQHSDALIMNIDYPLGLSAYELLSHVSSRVGRLVGVYIMGKAATLNGRIGDVMVPNVVHDEHSANTYLFMNAFNASHISPYITLGAVLDNQKAITAYGTFLQNKGFMDVFYEEGYTILEMEAGPYLSAIYESVRPRRHPTNELVRLYETSLDVGILHYASDTPLSKGHNLGAGSLGYAGVEPTYAASIAILKRILMMESERQKLPDRGVTQFLNVRNLR